MHSLFFISSFPLKVAGWHLWIVLYISNFSLLPPSLASNSLLPEDDDDNDCDDDNDFSSPEYPSSVHPVESLNIRHVFVIVYICLKLFLMQTFAL